MSPVGTPIAVPVAATPPRASAARFLLFLFLSASVLGLPFEGLTLLPGAVGAGVVLPVGGVVANGGTSLFLFWFDPAGTGKAGLLGTGAVPGPNGLPPGATGEEPVPAPGATLPLLLLIEVGTEMPVAPAPVVVVGAAQPPPRFL